MRNVCSPFYRGMLNLLRTVARSSFLLAFFLSFENRDSCVIKTPQSSSRRNGNVVDGSVNNGRFYISQRGWCSGWNFDFVRKANTYRNWRSDSSVMPAFQITTSTASSDHEILNSLRTLIGIFTTGPSCLMESQPYEIEAVQKLINCTERCCFGSKLVYKYQVEKKG